MANQNDTQKDLVAEQPGLGLSFIGLFLAFFVGLAVRAAVSPDRVQEHLLKATESIHRDLHFSFKKAYVSFSRGLWPDLSVVVEGVAIESQQACWLTPLAEIHEIRLPMSFRHLFRGQILIHEVLADEVNLSLRTPYSACSESKTAAVKEMEKSRVSRGAAQEPKTAAAAATGSTTVSNPVMGRFENVRRKNPIDTLQIDSLKIHYLPVAFTSFLIQDFQAKLKAEDPRWIQVIGRMVLDSDMLTAEYGSFADLQIDAIEGETPSLQAVANGSWREGHYALNAKFDAKEQKLSASAEALHLPLSQIIPLLKKYRWVESEFNGKQAWISGHMKIEGPLSQLKNTPMNLDHLKLEGDLGEITCNQASIQSFQPLKFEPLDFQIRGLNVKELLVFLNRPHPSPALGELGLFNGSAYFVNPEHVVLRGDYSGLEFIFSNRGNRQSQVLSLVSGELDLNKQKWDINIDRIKPVEGIFEGKVKMQADKDFKDLFIDAQITELGLSPKVQSLMTGGGSLGALSGQLRTHLKAAQVSEMKGQLKWDQLLIEGLRLSRPKMNIQSVGEEVQLNVSAQEMELSAQSPVAQVFAPLLKNHSDNSYLFKSPTGLIKTKKFSTLAWEQVKAQAPWGVLTTQGHWNEKSELSGEILLQGSQPEHWQVQGTRNQPQFLLRSL